MVLVTVPLALLSFGCSGGSGPFATPIATPQSTATPTPSGTPAAVTGQRFVAQISAASGFNGTTTALDLTELSSSLLLAPSSTVTTVLFDNGTGATTPGATPPRQVEFTLVTPGLTGVQSGTYLVGGAGSGKSATTRYSEGATKSWEGTSGSIIVDSAGSIIRFRFVGVKMSFSRGSGSTASRGSFTLDGSGNADPQCLNRSDCSNGDTID